MVQGTDIHVSAWQQVVLCWPETKRLLAACFFGGLVGLERELRHKESGLRTNMLVCMGAALFTIMSEVLAGDSTPNKGQVAANIVQGVGFLGAGLILHNRRRVSGLTTAATVFAVAAIGMTCGAGLYLEGLLATLIVLFALWIVGSMESRLGWHIYPMTYEVRAEIGTTLPSDAVGERAAGLMAADVEAARHRMAAAILKVLDAAGVSLQLDAQDNLAGLERMTFTVLATDRAHARILSGLRASDETDTVLVFRDLEDD